MIRPILRYGEAPLHEPAREVTAVDDDLQRLVNDMIETMYAAPGVGLAAPQVGVPLRLFVCDVSVGRDPKGLIVMINPTWVEREGMQLEEEGCLSLPDLYGAVPRAEQIVVSAFDLSGQEFEMTLKDLPSRCVQHETDHLDGVLFIDRVNDTTLRELLPHLEDLEQQFRRGQKSGTIPETELLEKHLKSLEPR